MKRSPEHNEQRALFSWADAKAGEHPELSVLFAVPNGGHRHTATAARLKREGLRAGVPDVVLPVPRGGYGALFIEMKVKPNRVTEKQQAWLDRLEAVGNRVAVCYSWPEAVEVIEHYLKGSP